MEKYIPLDAVLVEINRLIAELVEKGENTMFEQGRISAFEDAKLFLDTLEAKEVDFDRDIRAYLTDPFNIYEDGVLKSKKSGLPLSTYDIIKVAKHFFKLGLKAQKGEEV